jgi:hypothetical protein
MSSMAERATEMYQAYNVLLTRQARREGPEPRHDYRRGCTPVWERARLSMRGPDRRKARSPAGFPLRRSNGGPGDALVVYTDGLTEARDTAGRFFSRQGLRRSLDGRRTDDAFGLVNGVRDGLQQFSVTTTAPDDITILALVYRRSLEP